MNSKAFAIAVFLFIQVVVALPSASAEGEKRGQNGHISKDEMLQIFRAGESDPEKGWVDGYEVAGKDIVEIINEAKVPIRIKNSIIKGGLDFTSLPVTSIDKLTMPSNWNTDRWNQLVETTTKKHITRIIFISNTILIIDSNIDGLVRSMMPFSHDRTTIFDGGARFGGATFSGVADFKEAIFRQGVFFNEARFSGDAHFDGATFSAAAYFDGATFSGVGDFRGATFSRDADFLKAEFRGGASFLGTKFWKTVQFKDSIFSNILGLDSIKIKEYAGFRNAQIERLDFCCRGIPAVIEGHMDLRDSNIAEAHFQDITFEKDVDFSNATLGLTVFRFVTFGSDASFIGTNMNDCFAFENINIKGVANFTRAQFTCSNCANQKRFCLSHVNLNNLILQWNQLPDYRLWVTSSDERVRSFLDQAIHHLTLITGWHINVKTEEPLQPLSQVFEHLEASFRKSNQLDGANWAYYNKKESKRIEDQIGWLKTSNSKWFEWFEWLTWGKATGYGTKLGRVITWCVGLYLIFAFILYWGKPTKKGQKAIKHPTAEEQDSEFKQRFLTFPNEYMTNYTGIWKNKKIEKIREDIVNSLWLSFVVFFKFGYRDVSISGGFYRFIVRLEWILGWFFLAALAITIANTVPLLHSLLSGVLH